MSWWVGQCQMRMFCLQYLSHFKLSAERHLDLDGRHTNDPEARALRELGRAWA
jgi:hypothetical protein